MLRETTILILTPLVYHFHLNIINLDKHNEREKHK
jgi:hypothetical protein